MNRKIFVLAVMAVLLFLISDMVFGKNAEAGETETGVLASGACGEVRYDFYDKNNNYIDFQADKSVKYRLYKDGTMVIYGNGEMGDFDTWNDCCTWYRRKDLIPWYDYRKYIKRVVVKDGVESIGCDAFYGCKNLESVQWADSIKAINGYAFYGCGKLESISWTDGIEWVSQPSGNAAAFRK